MATEIGKNNAERCKSERKEEMGKIKKKIKQISKDTNYFIIGLHHYRGHKKDKYI